MAKFKVGDRVRLTDEAAIRFGRSGETGTVDSIVQDAPPDAVYVRWASGDRPFYFADRLTLADPAPTGPRYVVRAASEMRNGEPCYPLSFRDVEHGHPIAERLELGKYSPGDGDAYLWPGYILDPVCAVVDLRDPWHLANGTAPPPPAPVAPTRPSDGAIVHAWDACFHWVESGCKGPPPYSTDRDERGRLAGVTVRDGAASAFTARADYQTARSNELRRLAAESAERERCRVVVQCQDGGECDV